MVSKVSGFSWWYHCFAYDVFDSCCEYFFERFLRVW